MKLLILSTNSAYPELPYVRKVSGGAERGLRTYAEHAALTHSVTYLSTAHMGFRPIPVAVRVRINHVDVVHMRGPSVPGFQPAVAPARTAVWMDRVFKECRRLQPDVILTYATIPDTLAAVRAKRAACVPRVAEWMAGRSWLLHLQRVPSDFGLVAEAFSGKDLTLFETQALEDYTRDEIRLRGLPEMGSVARVAVPAAVIARQRIPDAVWAGASGPVVSCLATFKPGSKRQDLLIDAWPEVLNRVGPVTLVLAGEGPLRSAAQQRAEALGVNQWVQFTGNLPRDSVTQLLSASSISVLPTEFEGRPQALVEALSLGVPVAASDIAAVRETLAPLGAISERCLFRNTAESVSDTITRMLCDETLRAQIHEKSLVFRSECASFQAFDEAMAKLIDKQGD